MHTNTLTHSNHFESIINKGFGQPDITIADERVQALMNVCFTILKDEDTDPVLHIWLLRISS